ncbi:hypothetical protein LENED_008926 [Lentinula edodes]|uniref:Uncharacterized protein n=1 Tax=Lentinula edodes TaxID=5353 RepID=A0A1Q3EIC7_LENED|nr:hypothetical protein LENED_008926 [Lentinula edodes]
MAEGRSPMSVTLLYHLLFLPLHRLRLRRRRLFLNYLLFLPFSILLRLLLYTLYLLSLPPLFSSSSLLYESSSRFHAVAAPGVGSSSTVPPVAFLLPYHVIAITRPPMALKTSMVVLLSPQQLTKVL